MRIAALALLWAATGGLAHAAPSDGCAPALVVDQWQPFVELAGGPPADAALRRLDSLVALERLIAAHSAPDAKAAALRSRLWQGLRDYDLSAFYKALPETDGPWRAATFASHATDNAYVISVADARTTSLADTGDSRTRIAARPAGDADAGDGFTLSGALDANIGPIGWPGVAQAFAKGLLRTAAPATVSAPGDTQQAAHAAFSTLDKADRPLMAQLWYGLPATWQWFAGIGRIESLTDGDTSPPGLHHLHYDAAFSKAGLRAHYPAVADYLDRIGDLMTAQLTVRSAAGQWLRYTVDSGARRITLDAWIDADGHLVPSVNGQPVAAAALGADPRSGRFETRLDTAMHAYGLTVHMNDLVTHWRFSRDANGARFVGRITDVPQTRVSGRAFGIIPAGMLDAIMPADMASFANRFMARLVASDGGQGARVALSVTDRDDGNRLQASGQGDFLDNLFVRFGVRMMNGRVLPDADQLAGLRRLLGDGLAAFAADRDRRAGIGAADATCRVR
ncbi:hypothetical protein [Salinisphaera sp. Q1T1-3]|uniref:hypothetical protein n=1 Tax=Salinisphaera sp. Q1T1-3 TaxID=2321229 RepID=UPI000E76C84B|nr:hypothetical protein [Salinisphaera sp. Q1T1-3]RJS94080.1 hypothetical protein D3260_05790 [Salinisphaera sp. Q1T1-3]